MLSGNPTSIGRLSKRASSPESSALAKRGVRFVDQPHGGATSLGLRFDEDDHSIAYAIDFSDLTMTWPSYIKALTCGSRIA